MTTPSIVPTKYAANSKDFLKAKIDQTGALRVEAFAVTVPASTASGTVIGLVPFRKGARFVPHASGVFIADLDTGTSVTASIGYVYDDNVTFTNAPAAFVSGSTVPQTGGTIPVNGLVTSHTFVAQADGWIALTTAGGSTTTAGDVTGTIVLSYDA